MPDRAVLERNYEFLGIWFPELLACSKPDFLRHIFEVASTSTNKSEAQGGLPNVRNAAKLSSYFCSGHTAPMANGPAISSEVKCPEKAGEDDTDVDILGVDPKRPRYHQPLVSDPSAGAAHRDARELPRQDHFHFVEEAHWRFRAHLAEILDAHISISPLRLGANRQGTLQGRRDRPFPGSAPGGVELPPSTYWWLDRDALSGADADPAARSAPDPNPSDGQADARRAVEPAAEAQSRAGGLRPLAHNGRRAEADAAAASGSAATPIATPGPGGPIDVADADQRAAGEAARWNPPGCTGKDSDHHQIGSGHAFEPVMQARRRPQGQVRAVSAAGLALSAPPRPGGCAGEENADAAVASSSAAAASYFAPAATPGPGGQGAASQAGQGLFAAATRETIQWNFGCGRASEVLRSNVQRFQPGRSVKEPALLAAANQEPPSAAAVRVAAAAREPPPPASGAADLGEGLSTPLAPAALMWEEEEVKEERGGVWAIGEDDRLRAVGGFASASASAGTAASASSASASSSARWEEERVRAIGGFESKEERAIGEWLEDLGLGMYGRRLKEEGWDSVEVRPYITF